MYTRTRAHTRGRGPPMAPPSYYAGGMPRGGPPPPGSRYAYDMDPYR